MRTASIKRSPSLSRGMNSPPRFRATGTLAPTSASARITAATGWRMNASSAGW